MADEGHLAILKKGVEAWNEWRSRNPDTEPDLSEANLSQSDLGWGIRAKFSKADFHEANLDQANFGDANLDEADLTAAKLKGAIFSKGHIVGADFSEAHLDGADFSEARLKGTKFNRAFLDKAIFCKARLHKANLSRAYLEKANLRDADFTEAVLSGARLAGADLSETNFYDADLANSSLENATLRAAGMIRANLRGADLGGTDLRNSTLYMTDLRYATLNDKTRFNGADVKECRIQRSQLEFLKDYGGLTKGDLAEMRIEDDIGNLRASFRGINLWMHLIALVAFLFPYLSFAGIRYFEARFNFNAHADTIPLWEAIARYIWNGGQNWQYGWHFHLSFVAFVILTFYNLCRWILLSKTSELEHRQQIVGFPVNFRGWERYFVFYLEASMRWLSWACLGILVVNTGYFLTQEVPIVGH